MQIQTKLFKPLYLLHVQFKSKTLPLLLQQLFFILQYTPQDYRDSSHRLFLLFNILNYYISKLSGITHVKCQDQAEISERKVKKNQAL